MGSVSSMGRFRLVKLEKLLPYVVELSTDGAYFDFITHSRGISISDICTNGLGGYPVRWYYRRVIQQYFGGSYQASGSSRLVCGTLLISFYLLPTQAPTDPQFHCTALTIAENQPIGTVVGEFNATDADSGATLTYGLVSGAEDGSNSFFSLETNGTP